MDSELLSRSIKGRVVARTHVDYEATLRALVWNQLAPPRRPELIVHAESVRDVIASVDFARHHGLRVAVRSGGHAWCGAALRDGGVLIDVGHLHNIEIDVTRAAATVGPGAMSSDLARELAARGYAFPLGHCATVRVGGYLLSGGLGWNPGGWGPACLSVDAVDVVTADARAVRASATEHPELFWAARGGGAGFCGAVVGFHLRLHPLPAAIITSTLAYPLDAVDEVGRLLDQSRRSLPPFVEAVLVVAAGSPSKPARCVLTATAFAEDEDIATAALAPLAACRGSLSRFESRRTSFEMLYTTGGEAYPERHRYLADAIWSHAPASRVVTSIAGQVAASPSPQSHVLCSLFPAIAPPDAAFSMTAPLYVAAYAAWSDAADDAANIRWHRAVTGALAPFTAGYYVGEADVIGDPERARRAFSPAAWTRLAKVRQAYDPDGLFEGFPDR